MSQSIHLGYVVGTGEAVEIPLRHTAVTGQTQESGKTTTLEGLISRSGLQAVAYVTKRGESSFHVMQPIPPFFQERADWKFVQSLLEAATEQKLKFEQSWIMRASEGARTLQDVQRNIRRFLEGVRDTRVVKQKKGAEVKERWTQKPARGLSGDIYYVLNKYLDDIMPQLGQMPYTTALELAPGLNVMDLRDYEFPLQALVIRSVTDRIREHLDGTINIIPEAWKFAPKFRGSPVRLAAEEYVREAAAMKNFLWIDSQDLAGVADVLMRQVGVWLFGVQRATREIWRALEHMPEGLPAKRPRPADIATLSKGQFYVCFGREMRKVYVQPAWMTAAHAEAIARGEEEVESARDILKEYAIEHKGRSDAGSSKPKPPSIRHGVRSDVQDSVTVRGTADGLGASERSAGSGSESIPGTEMADAVADREEDVWKEKYEELKADHDILIEQFNLLTVRLRQTGVTGLGVAPGAVPDFGFPGQGGIKPNGAKFDLNGDLSNIYVYVKDRASKDPGILEILREQPQLQVKTTRPVISVDAAGSLFGRICQLTAEGFFKQPQSAKVATAEAVRRGWCHPKTPFMRLADPLDKLAGMGFLTREADGYMAVSGVKIKMEEA